MAEMKTRVFATVRFEGFHHWPDAPVEVAFLRDLHRHIFHVRAEVLVSNRSADLGRYSTAKEKNLREVEFILLGRRVSREIERIHVTQDTSCWSCERWATTLLDNLNLDRCEVSEDGENGSVVSMESE
jgi:hypothetical protein